jgi:putative ABC transport system substrate-binding protein
MRRRDFIAALSFAGAWPAALYAQRSAQKIFRVGMLETTAAAQNAANLDAFRGGLRALGYVEGQNVVIEYRSADGRSERFPELAAELIKLAPDVLVTRGTPAATAAQQATTTIPIVMAAIGEPFRVVASLARPGGNVTGLSALVSELEGKRIEILRELRPDMARLAAIMNMDNPASATEWKQVAEAARSLGLVPQLLAVRKPEEIEGAFTAAGGARADALVVGLDTLTQTHAALIVGLAAKARLSAIYASREFADVGGLVFYGVNYPDLYRRAAAYVAKILNGAKPADLPIEEPTAFSLVVNLKTAKLLGLRLPETILLRADEVIE